MRHSFTDPPAQILSQGSLETSDDSEDEGGSEADLAPRLGTTAPRWCDGLVRWGGDGGVKRGEMEAALGPLTGTILFLTPARDGILASRF